MIKVGKISAKEGSKYRVLFEELGEMVTTPFPRIGEKRKLELSPGEQILEHEIEDFEIGEKVVVAFTSEQYQEGIILGLYND